MGPYFKFGLYNWGWRDPSRWVGPAERLLWHDELRIGDATSSYAEVSPPSLSSPLPPQVIVE
jgi:hypothetical protein